MDATENLAASWSLRRFTIAGFGKARFGTNPFGARAAAFNLAAVPYTADAAAAADNLAGAWSAD